MDELNARIYTSDSIKGYNVHVTYLGVQNVSLNSILRAFMHQFDELRETYKPVVTQNQHTKSERIPYFPTLVESVGKMPIGEDMDTVLQGYFSLMCPETGKTCQPFSAVTGGNLMIKPIELIAKELGIENEKADSSR